MLPPGESRRDRKTDGSQILRFSLDAASVVKAAYTLHFLVIQREGYTDRIVSTSTTTTGPRLLSSHDSVISSSVASSTSSPASSRVTALNNTLTQQHQGEKNILVPQ